MQWRQDTACSQLVVKLSHVCRRLKNLVFPKPALCSFACLTSPLQKCYVRTHHLLCCCCCTVHFSSAAGLGLKQPATSAVCQLQNGCLTLRASKSGGRAGLSAYFGIEKSCGSHAVASERRQQRLAALISWQHGVLRQWHGSPQGQPQYVRQRLSYHFQRWQAGTGCFEGKGSSS